MNPRELLVDTFAYLAPARTLEGLTTADAEQRLDKVNHSIAEIVAHLAFWQEWFCGRCEGVGAPMVSRAADGWPAVAAGDWPRVQERFLAGTERAASIGADADRLARPIVPAIDFPPLASFTIRDALVHVATHNAHHLGQVVVLRQLLGAWPPPAGSWTW